MPFSPNVQVVQHSSASHTYTSGTGTGSTFASFGHNVTKGNLIVACITGKGLGNQNANVAISGSLYSSGFLLPDNWQAATTVAVSTGVSQMSTIWVNPNTQYNYTNVYVNQMTFGYTANSSSAFAFFLDIYEISGMALTAVIDQSSTGHATNTKSWNSGTTGSTTFPYEFWISTVGIGANDQNTTISLTPAGPWTTSPLLSQAASRGGGNVTNSYQQSAYQIVSAESTTSYSGTTSAGANSTTAVVTLVGSKLFGSDSDSFRNQGEHNTVNATLSSSDSFVNLGETNVVRATIVDSDAFANQGETNNVEIIITDTDSFANQGETGVVKIGIQDQDSGHFQENSNLQQYIVANAFPLFFYPSVPKPVVAPIYNGHLRNSAVAPISWNNYKTIDTQKTILWRVTQQQKSATVAIAWKNYFRVEVAKLNYGVGLPRPVVNPIDWFFRDNQSEWRNDQRTSAFITAWWNALTTVQANNNEFLADTWNVLSKVTVQQATVFRVRNKVTAPVIVDAYESGAAVLPRPVVYPIDPGAIQLTSTLIQWRLNSRRSASKKISWNNRIPVKAQKAIAFVDNGILVKATVQGGTLSAGQIAWMLKKKVSSSQATSWRDVVRRFSLRKTAWQTEFRTSTQKAVKFNVRNKVVAQTPAIQWKQVAHVTARQRITWWDRLARSPKLRTTWMTLFRINETPILNPPAYSGKVVDQVVHPVGAMQGFAPNKRVTWHLPITHVIAQSPTGNAGVTSIKWMTEKRIKSTQATAWKTTGRKSVQQPTQFNVVIAVKPQVIIKWNVALVLVDRIHVSAKDRQDFAY